MDEGLVREEGARGLPFEAVLLPGADPVARPARGLAHAEGEKAEDYAGRARQVEGGPPAVVFAHVPAEQEAESASHRNRHVEEGQHAPARLSREEVADEGGCDHAEAGLAHADQRAGQEQVVVAAGQAREDRGQAPEEHSAGHQEAAWPAVAQHAGEGRRHHVGHHEHRADEAQLGVVEAEVLLEQRPYRRDHVAVDVVEEVHPEEQSHGKEGLPPRDAGRGHARRSRGHRRRLASHPSTAGASVEAAVHTQRAVMAPAKTSMV